MPIDREERLQFFLKNYLPKSEILYRLPLNMQIGPFWSELINRRKAGGTILPLHTPTLKPCWYTLTEKMIHASEILAEEASERSDANSPIKMTTAMTEEMYYTTYVEGGQISLEEAMDFLNEEREASNVEELMVWNNRIAWEQMIRNLYYPITENSLLQLAYLLTEGMDNCTESYRTTETHPIPAMSGEHYRVPAPESIPGHMQELVNFLRDPDVHPLIKAPAAAASILINRPYPEGNERLSRMLSSMILLRCGYDFFKDVSLSSVIAQENFLYYKNICEIIREQNEGDLTYFFEYYLEMLVRALQLKKQRELRREQEKLEKERALSAQPLRTSAQIVSDSFGRGKYGNEMYLICEKLQNGELDVIGCDDIVSMTGLEEKQAVGILGRMVRNKLLIPTGNPQKGKKTYMLAQKDDDEQLSYSKEAREQRYNEAVSMIKKSGLRDEAKKLLLDKLMENSINSLRIIPYLVNQVQDGVHVISTVKMSLDCYKSSDDRYRQRCLKDFGYAVKSGLIISYKKPNETIFEISPDLFGEMEDIPEEITEAIWEDAEKDELFRIEELVPIQVVSA